jgi:hypothetical protein
MAERDDEEDEDAGEGSGEMISTREIEAQVRKAAKEKVVFQVSALRDDWMTADLTGLPKYDDVGSFDPSDTSFMDRSSDDDEPSLRTREVAKKSLKVTRTRDPVDAMVRFHYTSPATY